MKKTGVLYNDIFYETWLIIDPSKGEWSGLEDGLVRTDFSEKDLAYWTYFGLQPIKVIEKEVYDKCLLDLNEITAKYNFMVDSAQQNARERDAIEAEATKYRNVYSAEAVTSRILGDELELLQNANSMTLWGLTVTQVLSLMKYYEANTGNKAQDIK